jgi:anti-sigma B factor antagonist
VTPALYPDSSAMTVDRTALEISSLTERLTRIVLSGRLDAPGVDRIETQFVAAVVPAAKNVVVDLSRVEFIASMGIRMLVSVARSLQQRRARLVLYGPSPLVNEVFKHVSLQDLMPIVADETAAIAAITP